MKKLLLLLFLFNSCSISKKTGAQTPVFSLADSLFSLGKYAEAISVYEKIEPTTARVYVKMAQAYRAKGNFGKTLENYELGLSKNSRLNYYRIFVEKFKMFPNAKPFLAVAEYRISELKKEKFMGE